VGGVTVQFLLNKQTGESRTCNKVIHSKKTGIIRQVKEHCDKEAHNNCLYVPIQKATE
jgi:hypothetical protein